MGRLTIAQAHVSLRTPPPKKWISGWWLFWAVGRLPKKEVGLTIGPVDEEHSWCRRTQFGDQGEKKQYDGGAIDVKIKWGGWAVFDEGYQRGLGESRRFCGFPPAGYLVKVHVLIQVEACYFDTLKRLWLVGGELTTRIWERGQECSGRKVLIFFYSVLRPWPFLARSTWGRGFILISLRLNWCEWYGTVKEKGLYVRHFFRLVETWSWTLDGREWISPHAA